MRDDEDDDEEACGRGREGGRELEGDMEWRETYQPLLMRRVEGA